MGRAGDGDTLTGVETVAVIVSRAGSDSAAGYREVVNCDAAAFSSGGFAGDLAVAVYRQAAIYSKDSAAFSSVAVVGADADAGDTAAAVYRQVAVSNIDAYGSFSGAVAGDLAVFYG